MDTIAVVIVVYLVLLALYCILVAYMRWVHSYRKIEKMNERNWMPWEKDWRRWDTMLKIKNLIRTKLIWQGVLGIQIEAFLIFAIAGFMQVQLLLDTTSGEIFGILFGIS